MLAQQNEAAMSQNELPDLIARVGAGRLGAKAARGRLRTHLLVAFQLPQLLGALTAGLVGRAGPLTLWWRLQRGVQAVQVVRVRALVA